MIAQQTRSSRSRTRGLTPTTKSGVPVSLGQGYL